MNQVELPKWYKEFSPVHNVTAECVLEWPDDKNCNEFPVICPVHGILSRWCLKPGTENCTCGPPVIGSLASMNEKEASSSGARSRKYKTIEEVLQALWGGENIPCFMKGMNSGTPADSLTNRRAAFMGDQLSLTPRGPVVVNSHSLKARTDCNKKIPRIDIDKVPLGYVYRYLEDLGMDSEWCVVFISQIRHVMPADLNVREQYRYVSVYQRKNRTGFLLNVFPNTKCFVTFINYDDFEWRPKLNYGDQVLEIQHGILVRPSENQGQRSPHHQNVFRLRVRPCPFLKWLRLGMGPCPLVTERSNFRPSQHTLRSHLDMGFSIYNGCVTAVAVNSPAQAAGLRPDHHIVEVGGVFVVNHNDQLIIQLIRQKISANPRRFVDLVVIPERVHQQLRSVENIHNIVSNRGFHMDPWVNAEPFGLSPEHPDVEVFEVPKGAAYLSGTSSTE